MIRRKTILGPHLIYFPLISPRSPSPPTFNAKKADPEFCHNGFPPAAGPNFFCRKIQGGQMQLVI